MEPAVLDDNTTNLLWTGGWDSTFQLLRLLILYKHRVTPFYLIDENRRSTGMEIQTMRHIKNQLFKKYPHTQQLIGPTQYFGVETILPDLEIEKAFSAIREEKFMGDQYDWLARFCKQYSIHNMQLCIHQDDKAHLVIKDIVLEENNSSLNVFRIDPQFNLSNEYEIFRYFSFPLLNITKVQMASIAREQGWQQEMQLTWFCHSPRKDMKPCGRCNPCLYTIEEGLAWRIPVSSRISSFFHRVPIRPVKKFAKRMFK